VRQHRQRLAAGAFIGQLEHLIVVGGDDLAHRQAGQKRVSQRVVRAVQRLGDELPRPVLIAAALLENVRLIHVVELAQPGDLLVGKPDAARQLLEQLAPQGQARPDADPGAEEQHQLAVLRQLGQPVGAAAQLRRQLGPGVARVAAIGLRRGEGRFIESDERDVEVMSRRALAERRNQQPHHVAGHPRRAAVAGADHRHGEERSRAIAVAGAASGQLLRHLVDELRRAFDEPLERPQLVGADVDEIGLRILGRPAGQLVHAQALGVPVAGRARPGDARPDAGRPLEPGAVRHRFLAARHEPGVAAELAQIAVYDEQVAHGTLVYALRVSARYSRMLPRKASP
jgi:hypothetical protein